MITIFNSENNFFDLIKILYLYFLNNYKNNNLKKTIKDLYPNHSFIDFYCTGRSALYDIIKSLQLNQKFKVGIQAFTCSVVPKAIIESGGIPLYFDIEKETFSMDINKLTEKITELDIVIIQYTYGLIPKYIKEIIELCEKHNKYIILDKAHCMVDNTSLGNSILEDKCYGIFYSTDHTKSINAVKGGISICKSNFNVKYLKNSPSKISNTLIPFIFETIFFYKNIYFLNRIIKALMKCINFDYMYPDDEDINSLSKFKMDLFWEYCVNYQIQQQIKRRKNIKIHFKKIFDIFKKSKNIKINQKINLNSIPMRIPVIFQCEKYKKKVIKELKRQNILISDWFPRPLTCTEDEYHKYSYKENYCPVAEEISSKIIAFPCGKRFRQKYF